MKNHPKRSFPLLLLASLTALSLAACLEPVHEAPEGSLTWDEDVSEGEASLRRIEASPGGGARVLWWNINAGELNRRLIADAGTRTGAKRSILDENIGVLVHSTARPDVVVLGECEPQALDRLTFEMLETEYPFHTYYGYSPEAQDRGICVYSSFPMRLESEGPLDWMPPSLVGADERRAHRDRWERRGPEAREAVRFYPRTYQSFRIRVGSASMSLVPVHLVQPWTEVSAIDGSVATASAIIRDTDTPLVHQINRLMDRLKADFGAGLDREPLLVIGDFNVPKTMIALQTQGYRAIIGAGALREAFGDAPFTFPSVSAPERSELKYKLSPLKLDHAFVSSRARVREAAVLRLQGSDHYPVFVIVDPLAPSGQ